MPSDTFIVDVNSTEFNKIVDEYKNDMNDPEFDTDVKTYLFNRSTRWLTILEK
jgi:hypothetical protein